MARIRKTRLLSSTNSAAPGHGLCLVLQYQTMMVWHCLWTKAAMFFFLIIILKVSDDGHLELHFPHVMRRMGVITYNVYIHIFQDCGI